MSQSPNSARRQRKRLRVHVAIGKAADDLGDYAFAMQHFDAADALHRGSMPFDSAAFSIEIDRLIARCTPELIARAPELGSSNATPVLILGMRGLARLSSSRSSRCIPLEIIQGLLTFWAPNLFPGGGLPGQTTPVAEPRCCRLRPDTLTTRRWKRKTLQPNSGSKNCRRMG